MPCEMEWEMEGVSSVEAFASVLNGSESGRDRRVYKPTIVSKSSLCWPLALLAQIKRAFRTSQRWIENVAIDTFVCDRTSGGLKAALLHCSIVGCK